MSALISSLLYTKIMLPMRTEAHCGSKLNLLCPAEIPCPDPIACQPLLSSNIHPRISTVEESQVGVPMTRNSIYSFAPEGPCDNSLMTICASAKQNKSKDETRSIIFFKGVVFKRPPKVCFFCELTVN